MNVGNRRKKWDLNQKDAAAAPSETKGRSTQEKPKKIVDAITLYVLCTEPGKTDRSIDTSIHYSSRRLKSKEGKQEVNIWADSIKASNPKWRPQEPLLPAQPPPIHSPFVVLLVGATGITSNNRRRSNAIHLKLVTQSNSSPIITNP